MRKGFIFNQNRCVACGACDAACILENGWSIHARTVYKYNQEANPGAPVINLSMACNHCEIPSCMQSCPVNAYYRDISTGAVLIDENRCIGCNYCKWNCPYDAPKTDPLSLLIRKCTLCQPLLKDGRSPSCASACPTGALDYNVIQEKSDNRWLTIFPEKNLNPALVIPEDKKSTPLRIEPSEIFDSEFTSNVGKEKNIRPLWSLIAFTFLATLSVSLSAASLLTANKIGSWMPLALILVAGTSSVFHLERKLRAWKAVNNIIRSPLSREIALYVLYTALSALAIIIGNIGILLAAAFTGALMLITIDLVYAIPDSGKLWYFHSGQTFISGLLIFSFFAALKSAFIFLALVKIASVIYNLFNTVERQSYSGLSFLRLALLTIAGISFVTGISYYDPIVSILFISGELSDRILFYLNFEPLNINTFIPQQLKNIRNEKKSY